MASAIQHICLILVHINVAWSLIVAAPSNSLRNRNSSLPVQLSLDSRQDANSTDATPHCGYDTLLMAECTELLYKTKAYCGCWDKVKVYTAPSNIRIALYRTGNSCLLGISGQMNGAEQFNNNPPGYFMKHDPVLSEPLCGRQTVRGFAMQARKLFTDFEWATFSHYLASDKCYDGVGVLGTSWGGAIGEILAGCANQGSLQELQGAGLPTFQVSRLYTFGAPPSALMPIYNHQSGSEACFAGQRVFLAADTESGPTDLVAYSTAMNAMVHARMDAVQLIKLPSGLFSVKIHKCHSYESITEPDWQSVSPVLTKLWNDHATEYIKYLGKYVQKTHQMAAYVQAMHDVADPVQLLANEQRQIVSLRIDAKSDAGSFTETTRHEETADASKEVKEMASKTSDLVANSFDFA